MITPRKTCVQSAIPSEKTTITYIITIIYRKRIYFLSFLRKQRSCNNRPHLFSKINKLYNLFIFQERTRNRCPVRSKKQLSPISISKICPLHRPVHARGYKKNTEPVRKLAMPSTRHLIWWCARQSSGSDWCLLRSPGFYLSFSVKYWAFPVIAKTLVKQWLVDLVLPQSLYLQKNDLIGAALGQLSQRYREVTSVTYTDFSESI